MTPANLDLSHTPSTSASLWAAWSEIWPYLAGGVGVVALVVLAAVIVVDLVKAYKRGNRRKGEE